MNDYVELRQAYTIIRRGWWVIALLVVVGAAIGYGVTQSRPPVYAAATTLIVGQSLQSTQLDSRDIQTSQQLAQTYANIARRQAVLQRVVDKLSLSDTWRALQSRVRVQLVTGTQLLEIRVEANSADEARDTADEIARQLIQISPTADLQQEDEAHQQFVRQQLGNLQAKIESAQERINMLERAMTGPALLPVERLQELQTEISALERLIADWQANYAQLLLFTQDKTSVNYLTVLEPAQVSRVSNRALMNTLLAGLVGLAVSLGFIFLREHLRDTLRSADDLNRALGLAYLGAVSKIRGKDMQHKLVTSQEMLSPVSEAYRIIRSNIQFMSADRPTKSLMVTSSSPGEGKSVTAANLGVVMAQAGIKTILVDADMRRPVLHQFFDVPNQGGLADFLCSPELTLNGQLKETHVENLKVLPSGVMPPNPAELLGSARMGELLARLKEMAEVVIFDSPPALDVADAAILSGQVDGVVLVIDAEQTQRDIARQAKLSLQQAGASVLGGVLNRVSTMGTVYY